MLLLLDYGFRVMVMAVGHMKKKQLHTQNRFWNRSFSGD